MRRLLAVAFLLAATPASAATFSAPFPISSGTYMGGQVPVVAVAPTGAAVAAFTLFTTGARRLGSSSPLQVALRPAGGSFGAATDVGDPARTGTSPAVAMDAAGDATVAWTEFTSGGKTVVRVATAPAGQGFGAAVTLSDPARNTEAPSVAVDSAGDAIVAWSYYSGGNEIAYATRTGTGAFGSAQSLATPAVSISAPRVVMNAHGDAVIVYEQDDTSTSYHIMASRRPAGGSPTTPVAVTPDGARSQNADAGLDAAGDATIGYQVLMGTCTPCTDTQHAVTLSASGTVGTDQTLGVPSGTGALSQVAVDGAGNAAVAWLGGASKTDVLLATAAPAGTFGSPATLDTAGQFGVAMGGDPAGDLLLAWPHTVGSSAILRYALRPGAAGSLSTPTDLNGSVPFFGDAALTSPDDAVLDWLDTASSNYVVKGSSTGSGAAPVVTPTVTATVAPTASPTPTPKPGTYALPLKVSLKKAKGQTRRRVLKHHVLRVKCTLTRAGTCVVKASYKRRTLANGKAKFKAAGTKTVKLKLSRAARRFLKHHRKAKLKITATATSGSTIAAAKPLKLKLK